MSNIDTNPNAGSDNSGSGTLSEEAVTEAAAAKARNTEPAPAKPALVAANDNFPKSPILFQNTAYSEYKSRLNEWDTRASVRVLPRRQLTSLEGNLPFSPDLVPITAHPLVKARGNAALHLILGQKLHTYLNFTEQLELRNVVPTSINLRFGDVPFLVPHELKRDAGKVVTDEAHHADCAADLDEQLVKVTGVAPYRVRPAKFSETLHKCRNPFPGCLRLLLDTTFTTVSETLITGTLTQVPKDLRVAATVREVIMDHARDEAQHHSVFSEVMHIMWNQLTPEQKDVIGPHWATFIQAFLAPDLTAELDWLEAAGFDREEADRIIRETYEAIDLAQVFRQSARPTIRLAQKFGLTDHAATHEGLEAAGLLLAAQPRKEGGR
jgi:hypothetical protein